VPEIENASTQTRRRHFGERFRPLALLKQKVKAGYIGKKVGKGWRVG
jgi:3-hydroxyacyl-CoA dehydrogenase